VRILNYVTPQCPNRMKPRIRQSVGHSSILEAAAAAFLPAAPRPSSACAAAHVSRHAFMYCSRRRFTPLLEMPGADRKEKIRQAACRCTID